LIDLGGLGGVRYVRRLLQAPLVSFEPGLNAGQPQEVVRDVDDPGDVGLGLRGGRLLRGKEPLLRKGRDREEERGDERKQMFHKLIRGGRRSRSDERGRAPGAKGVVSKSLQR